MKHRLEQLGHRVTVVGKTLSDVWFDHGKVVRIVAKAGGDAWIIRAGSQIGQLGVVSGTAFALCEESGFEPGLKSRILGSIQNGDLSVRTDAMASPTGFPFKLASMPESIANPEIYQNRERVCDLGVLRESYQKPDGTIGFRCAAEPDNAYASKGGDSAHAGGRLCLCNSLCASVGIGQVRHGVAEPPLVSLGDDFSAVRQFISGGRSSYSAADVVRSLLA